MTRDLIFRRGKLSLFAWRLVPLFFWFMAALFAAAFFIGLSPVRSWTFEKAGVLIAFAVLAVISAQNAFRFNRWVRRFMSTFLALEPQGLRFHLPETGDGSLAWAEITDVKFEKRSVDFSAVIPFRGRVDACVVETTHGSFQFTAMDIPAPKRAAKEISSRLIYRP